MALKHPLGFWDDKGCFVPALIEETPEWKEYVANRKGRDYDFPVTLRNGRVKHIQRTAPPHVEPPSNIRLFHALERRCRRQMAVGGQ